jgi:hypothetical protein
MSNPKFEHEQKFRFTREQLVDALRMYTGRDIPSDVFISIESVYDRDQGLINMPDAKLVVGWKTQED